MTKIKLTIEVDAATDYQHEHATAILQCYATAAAIHLERTHKKNKVSAKIQGAWEPPKL